jgi:hypothetical protein
MRAKMTSMALPICAGLLIPIGSQGEDAPFGKYLCYVSHLVGIQFEKDGTVSAGNFKPVEDRFFLTVSAATPFPGCPNLYAKQQGLLNWYSCEARFEARIGNGPLLRSDDVHTFIGTLLASGEYFQIDYDSGAFVSNVTVMSAGGFYTSDGKCTKVG